jgi:hypothetical protein
MSFHRSDFGGTELNLVVEYRTHPSLFNPFVTVWDSSQLVGDGFEFGDGQSFESGPKEVEEYITNFCTEYNITRKDKEGNTLPSLGTGIVTYLKSQMMGESPSDVLAKPSKSLSNGLTKDEVLDLIREYNTSHLPSNGLTKNEVLDLVQQSITSQVPSNGLTKDEVIDLIEQSVTNSHLLGKGLTKDEVIDLIQEYSISHSPSNGLTEDEVLELIRKHGSSDLAERARPEREMKLGEPDWVNSDNRRFYAKLVNDPVVVGKVAEAIAQYPKDNKALATSLVEMGLHKNDGTALDSASMSRIKAVVGHLQQ